MSHFEQQREHCARVYNGDYFIIGIHTGNSREEQTNRGIFIDLKRYGIIQSWIQTPKKSNAFAFEIISSRFLGQVSMPGV
mgnify:CR=1 FL=1